METITNHEVAAPAVRHEPNSNAEMMKNISKARLNRKAMIDPGFARELVKLQATGVYNASGEVVQAVSASLGNA